MAGVIGSCVERAFKREFFGEAGMPQTNVKIEVALSDEQCQELESLVRSRSTPAGKVRRARVLLLADEDRRQGHRPDWYIAERVGVSLRQICRIRQQFARDGVVPTLARKARSDAGVAKTFDSEAEARLVALCCSEPPDGHQRWTLSLLVDELSRLKVVASVCRETVRQTLKKTGSSLGERNASASRNGTGRGSLPTWKKSSTSTGKVTRKRTR